MPGIDYRRLRTEISMRQVLELIGFEPRSSHCGDQFRCLCPFPASRETADRTFSVHLGRGLFHCFACGEGGNQPDLWASLHDLPFHQAARLLCQQTHTPIPWLTSPNR